MEKSYQCACNIIGFVPDPDVFQDAALTKAWELIFDRLCESALDDEEFHKLMTSIQRLTASMNQHRKLTGNPNEKFPEGISEQTRQQIEEAMKNI